MCVMKKFIFAVVFPSPARGYFLSAQANAMVDAFYGFPSPIRGLFFYRSIPTLHVLSVFRFRPLFGAYFFIDLDMLIVHLNDVSVPFSELIFLLYY